MLANTACPDYVAWLSAATHSVVKTGAHNSMDSRKSLRGFVWRVTWSVVRMHRVRVVALALGLALLTVLVTSHFSLDHWRLDDGTLPRSDSNRFGFFTA